MIFSHAQETAAQTGGAFPHFAWGGRFLAFGVEGVPVDDSFGSVYNPAAVRGCLTRQMSIQQIRPFEVPITGLSWCGDGTSGPWSWGGHAVLRQSPPGLGFDYNTYQIGVTVAYGHRWNGGSLVVGVTPKLLAVSIDGTGTSMDETAFGFALDAGVGFERPLSFGPSGGDTFFGDGPLFDRITVDGSVVDAVSRVYYKSGSAEPGGTAAYRLAVGLSGPRLMVGLHARWRDGQSSIGAGGEFTLFQAPSEGSDVLQRIALRGGVGDQGPAVGVGLVVRGFAVDYAYRFGVEQGAHIVSTAVRF